MSTCLLFTKFKLSMAGIIMLATGLTTLIFSALIFMVPSVVLAVTGLVLITVNTEKR